MRPRRDRRPLQRVPGPERGALAPLVNPSAPLEPAATPERWLAIHLPDLSLEIQGEGTAGDAPLAVSEQRQGPRILCANPRAAQGGVRPGMGVAAARALVAGLRVLPHRPAEERRRLEGIGAWCGQFTPSVSLEPPRSLVLEVGRSLTLFKGPEALVQRVRAGMGDLGHRAWICLAPTPRGALLLAAQGNEALIETRQALRSAVAALPLGVLDLGERWSRDLWAMGLRRVADLLRLPHSGLAERLGPTEVGRLGRILGEEPDPRLPFQPPPRFASRLELPAEVVTAEALGFAGRRLLRELGGYLLGRGAGVQRLEWRLRHPHRPPTRFSLGLARPERDPEGFELLLRERLTRLVLAEPVREIALLARRLQPLTPGTQELFPGGMGPQQDSTQRLLDRLAARLGQDRVRGLVLVPDHRPERAWDYAEPGSGRGGSGRAHRPLWLLPTPLPLEVQDGWPYYQGRLELVGERERIEAGWWDGAGVARDYFLALSPQGDHLWLFREHRGEASWFLQGLFG